MKLRKGLRQFTLLRMARKQIITPNFRKYPSNSRIPMRISKGPDCSPYRDGC
jgi:hypothetical protein